MGLQLEVGLVLALNMYRCLPHRFVFRMPWHTVFAHAILFTADPTSTTSAGPTWISNFVRRRFGDFESKKMFWFECRPALY